MESMLKSMGGLVLMMTWLAACGGESEPDGNGNMMQPSTTGSLRVSAATTGEDVDGDGYQVRVGTSSQAVGVNGSVLFASLAAQSHAVTLEGLSENCSTSNNPRAVTVTAGAESSTNYSVVCEAARTPEVVVQEASDSLGVALFRVHNDLDAVGDLDGLSFEPARALYEEALDLDPDDQTAAFGLAITTVFILEDDPDVRATAEAWQAWLDTHELDELNGVSALATPGPVLWKRGTLPLDPTGGGLARVVGNGGILRSLIAADAQGAMQDFPPTPAENQALLVSSVEPALLAALEYLESVDDPAFVFEITPAMQGENPGEADSLELDYTEVLALRFAFEVALAGVSVATAYVVEPTPWGSDGFAEAMEPGSSFGTLAADGSSRLSNARTRLLNAVDVGRSALTSLENESDDQDDDVIKYDPSALGSDWEDLLDEPLDHGALTEARDVLDDVEASLAGPRAGNWGFDDDNIEVDLSRFFLAPIQDLKALLPAYYVEDGRFRWEAFAYEEWTFPDPTLNGILPGMNSSEQLKEAIDDLGGLYEDFAPGWGAVDLDGTYVLYSIDGNPLPAITGDPPNTIEIQEGSLVISGEDYEMDVSGSNGGWNLSGRWRSCGSDCLNFISDGDAWISGDDIEVDTGLLGNDWWGLALGSDWGTFLFRKEP